MASRCGYVDARCVSGDSLVGRVAWARACCDSSKRGCVESKRGAAGALIFSKFLKDNGKTK